MTNWLQSKGILNNRQTPSAHKVILSKLPLSLDNRFMSLNVKSAEFKSCSEGRLNYNKNIYSFRGTNSRIWDFSIILSRLCQSPLS